MKILNKLFKSNYWDHYYYNLENVILDKNILQTALNIFWDNIILKKVKSDDQLIYIIFKVRFDDNTYSSLSYLQKVNRTQCSELIEIFNGYLDLKAENYSDKNYSDIIFTYHILSISDSDNKQSQLIPKNENKIKVYNFAGNNFPVTTNYSKWGIIFYNHNNFMVIKKENSKLPYKYEINILEDRAEVVYMINEKILYKFIDIFGSNYTSFTRILGMNEYTFRDGKLIIKKLKRKVKFFNKIKHDTKLTSKFITLDIETRTIDNKFIPYCISYYDGIKATSFYLSDYRDVDDMLTSCIINLLKRKYNGYKIYAHNLSNFDGIFLLKILSNIDNFTLNPIIRDGKLINLSLIRKVGNRTYKIDFRDSLLMLPLGLAKLAKAFNVVNKTIFPYNFVNNKEIPLDYIGPVPNKELYPNLTIEEYNSIKEKHNIWNLKDETIKYCENDCIALHQILMNFNNLIFNKYKLNVHKFPTLPSLTLAIYKSSYLIENTIPKITGDVYNFIRSGYTGGHSDMYKPKANNKEVYCYDVNSLYPSVMQVYDMPVGIPQYFEFNNFISIEEFLKFEKQPFGFFEVELSTPDKMNRPLFQTKVRTKNGLRTIAPIGTWTDIIFSEEMFNCMKYGYKFKVIRGYLFNRKNIFKDYINDLYKIKESLNKNDPMYLISKLLMNSLYGRFGMSNEMSKHIIIPNNNINNFINIQNRIIIQEVIDLNNGKSLLTILDTNDNQETLIDKDISIGIAAATTSYSRIALSSYLSNRNLDILYMDTDSLYITSKLPDKVISKKLGDWKLEHVFTKSVFISPKVYGGVTKQGFEITKIKGYKNFVPYSSLLTLLNREVYLSLKQDKLFKSIERGELTIKPKSLYTLVTTENKRRLIYKDNILVNTQPYKIDLNKNIINNS